MDITVIIVTYNRVFFMRRLLNYYKDVGFEYNLLIADASDTKDREINKDIYNNVKQHLNIDIYYLPGKNVIECIDEVVKVAKTPYCIINPDDDFLIPSTLKKMSTYLCKNKEYIAVNGSAVLVEERYLKDCGNKVISTGPYSMREVQGDTAENRLENLFDDYYGVLFSLYRTNIFKKIFRKTLGKGIISFELIPASRAALFGRIGHIKDLMLCRSANEFRLKIKKPIKQIFEPCWSEEVERFQSDVVNNLIEIDNFSYNEAVEIFIRIFSRYYIARFSHINNVSIWMRVKIFFYSFYRRPLIRKWNNNFYPWKNEFDCVRKIIEQHDEK